MISKCSLKTLLLKTITEICWSFNSSEDIFSNRYSCRIEESQIKNYSFKTSTYLHNILMRTLLSLVVLVLLSGIHGIQKIYTYWLHCLSPNWYSLYYTPNGSMQQSLSIIKFQCKALLTTKFESESQLINPVCGWFICQCCWRVGLMPWMQMTLERWKPLSEAAAQMQETEYENILQRW